MFKKLLVAVVFSVNPVWAVQQLEPFQTSVLDVSCDRVLIPHYGAAARPSAKGFFLQKISIWDVESVLTGRAFEPVEASRGDVTQKLHLLNGYYSGQSTLQSQSSIYQRGGASESGNSDSVILLFSGDLLDGGLVELQAPAGPGSARMEARFSVPLMPYHIWPYLDAVGVHPHSPQEYREELKRQLQRAVAKMPHRFSKTADELYREMARFD